MRTARRCSHRYREAGEALIFDGTAEERVLILA